ncbi:O-antigen ligase [Klenkia brasiliensis]|uniref:O-antigen ligase n=1 Tax=Klenkia brasiliensis TaxID=333142 RepID=A0A1G7MS40_9ACTN|nr:O-antigen ligase [Klenkia brasiliensis]
MAAANAQGYSEPLTGGKDGVSRRQLARLAFASLVAIVSVSPFRLSGPLTVGACVVVLLLCARRTLLSPIHWSSLIFFGWIGASSFWSVAGGATFDGVVLSLLLLLAAAAVWETCGPEQTLAAFLSGLRVVVALSAITYVFVPSIGREQSFYQAGAFTGLFVQRNVASFVMVVIIISTVALWDREWSLGRKHKECFWLILTLLCLLLARSSTSLVVLAAVLLLGLVVRQTRKMSEVGRRVTLAAVTAMVAGFALIIFTNYSAASGLLGRDASLTGRTIIWAAVLPFINAQPWIGYGWNALWTPGVQVTEEMWSSAHFAFAHAHNAFLDVILQVGFVGLVLLLIFPLGRFVVNTSRLEETAARPVVWSSMAFGCLLLYGVTEQSFVSNFGFLVLMMCSLKLAGAK